MLNGIYFLFSQEITQLNIIVIMSHITTSRFVILMSHCMTYHMQTILYRRIKSLHDIKYVYILKSKTLRLKITLNIISNEII